MSSDFKYTAGLHNAGSYQVSAIPFATGSIDVNAAGVDGFQIDFPQVTRWVYIVNNHASDLYVGFSQNGVKGSNHFTVDQGTTQRLEVKVTQLFLSGACADASVVAGLTTIPNARLNNISVSGSSWSGSSGVG